LLFYCLSQSHPFFFVVCRQAFASASADNIKKFTLPKGEFCHNMLWVHKLILIKFVWLGGSLTIRFTVYGRRGKN
jgi:hypothetical protein